MGSQNYTVVEEDCLLDNSVSESNARFLIEPTEDLDVPSLSKFIHEKYGVSDSLLKSLNIFRLGMYDHINSLHDVPRVHVIPDKYLFLMEQYKNCCWYHAICAVIGMPLHPNIFRDDWLSGLLTSFVYVEPNDIIKLDSPSFQFADDIVPDAEDQKLFFDFVGNTIPILVDPSKGLNNYLSTLFANSKNNSISHAEDGMSAVNFHQLCCTLNSSNGDYYIGARAIEDGSITSLKELLFEMGIYGANIVVMYAPFSQKPGNHKERKHYYTFWDCQNKRMVFYDPIYPKK